MDYAARLRQFGKKTIAKQELEALYGVNRDESLFPIIESLLLREYLQPVKSSLTNGNKRFPIYLKYRITPPAETFDAELSEIASLHPALQVQSYLQKKPALYRKYRDPLRKLDQYLFRQTGVPVPVSRKERSFEIFDEEKALDDRAFCGLLENLGIDSQVLGYYDTPEFCFNDYIPMQKSHMTLLICENKDIWFNIRRVMFEQKRFTLFGVRLDGVVYGCGNKVSQKEALTSYTHFMGTDDVTYLYWGDIDRAGLDIYLSLSEGNPDLDIRLFVPAYEEMLHLAQNRTIPDSDDERLHHKDYSNVLTQLSSQGQLWMEESIRLNKRIPQEIISCAYLKGNMRNSMALRSELAELLAGFEKRMKFINIVRFLLEYKYPDTIRAMIPDKSILDNVIVSVLVYINDRTLGAQKSCTLADIRQFLDDLSVILPDPERIDTAVLARYIIVDVLQKGGMLTDFQTFFSTSERFERMPIRLINEEKGSYHLTDDAFDFLFRSKEIESELDYSVTRFRMKEYMKRDNYEEALEASRELVRRIRNMKISMDDFLLRCREDISKITVDQYETIIQRIRTLLEAEYVELDHIQQTARDRIHALEHAQQNGIGAEDTLKHRSALREIITNISLTIAEQRSLINKKTSMAESYQSLIRDNFVVTRFERLNFERDIMVPLRKLEDPLGDAAKFLLFMLTKPEFENQFSIENFYAPQSKIDDQEPDPGIDISEEETDLTQQIQRRNTRHRNIIGDFFRLIQENDRFTANDFIRSLRVSDIEEYCADHALPNVLLTLFSTQELDIEGWKNEEHFTVVPNGEFELSWCLEEIPQEHLQVRKIRFTKLERPCSFECTLDGKRHSVDMTDFEVEVFR